MLVAVTSTKGSPGATTFALALAARWPSEAVLVEADPAGGDLGARCGVADDPGLASLVLAARREVPHLAHHAQQVGVGIDVVVAPASATRAAATIAALTPTALSGAGIGRPARRGPHRRRLPDHGRWSPPPTGLWWCAGAISPASITPPPTLQCVADPSRIGVWSSAPAHTRWRSWPNCSACRSSFRRRSTIGRSRYSPVCVAPPGAGTASGCPPPPVPSPSPCALRRSTMDSTTTRSPDRHNPGRTPQPQDVQAAT